MVAQDRLVFDIFTSSSKIRVATKRMSFSELCQYNDFVGIHQRSKCPLYFSINNTIYNVKKLLRLHPGGETMLKLYCGMDATKAWEGVKHSDSPAVKAMLEMFDTTMVISNIREKLNEEDANRYEMGWKQMTMLLVEIQNAMNLAFEKNWDKCYFTSAEEDLGEHFITWEGVTVRRPRHSLIKGELFIDIHNRLWSKFLPSLLSEIFENIKNGSEFSANFLHKICRLLSSLKKSRKRTSYPARHCRRLRTLATISLAFRKTSKM